MQTVPAGMTLFVDFGRSDNFCHLSRSNSQSCSFLALPSVRSPSSAYVHQLDSVQLDLSRTSQRCPAKTITRRISSTAPTRFTLNCTLSSLVASTIRSKSLDGGRGIFRSNTSFHLPFCSITSVPYLGLSGAGEHCCSSGRSIDIPSPRVFLCIRPLDDDRFSQRTVEPAF